MLPFILLAALAGAATAAFLLFAPLAAQGLAPMPVAESAAGGIAAALLVVAVGAAIVERRLKRRMDRQAQAAAGFEEAAMRGLRELEGRVTQAEQATKFAVRAGAEEKRPAVEPMSRAPARPAGAPAWPVAVDDEGGKVVPLEAALRARGEAAGRVAAEEIARAIDQGLVEARYQAMFGLPSRRTRILDCQPHLTVGGQELAPELWRAAASTAGKLAGFDRLMLLDCLRLVRELKRNQKPGAALWRMSRELLADEREWEETAGILKANGSVAAYLHCEIGLDDFLALSPVDLDRLHEIREMRHRLAISCQNGAGLLAGAVEGGLFSLVRAPVDVLLQPTGSGRWATDELRAAGGAQAEFAATGVTTEDEVITLIDHDVMLAQGPLLGLPRQLRQAQVAARPSTDS